MSEKNKKLKAAIKKQKETKGLGGTKTDVNQTIEEKNRTNPRRIKASDVLTAGSVLVGGPVGGTALKAGSKILPKIVKGAKKLLKKTGKTTKDIAVSTVKKAKLQPKRGKEYRLTKDKKTNKTGLSGISNRSTSIGKGIRGTVKTGTGALALTLVGGNRPKDKKVDKKVSVPVPKSRPPVPKSRPKNLKTSKKLYMREGSGLRKDDGIRGKDSKVEFKTEVIKRKK
tara:strand:+ start:431 stop:1108 length:678 start_codon:yes stop_codon:yes gene_type:complete